MVGDGGAERGKIAATCGQQHFPVSAIRHRLLCFGFFCGVDIEEILQNFLRQIIYQS